MPENIAQTAPAGPDGGLRADCTRCAGLCCVAPAFAASADFAIDKPAGHACLNLQPDFRCGIHADLRDRGFPGCTVFDCFGAGQHVTRTFAGRDWRSAPDIAEQMFTSFAIMRQLHELLWYLTGALALESSRPLHDDLATVLEETAALTRLPADELVAVDVTTHRAAINVLLLRTSELARAGAPQRRIDHRGADLMGRRFRGADLRGASFRGAYLIGADLRGADLRLADLIGADLRGADLRETDLRTSLFLTQFQINAARGDAATRLPPTLTRPPHWSASVIPIEPVAATPERPRRRR